MNENNNIITDYFTGEIIEADNAIYLGKEEAYCTIENAEARGYRECYDCGNWYHEANMYEIDGELYCEKCKDNGLDNGDIVYCQDCDELMRSDDAYYLDYYDKYVCRDCIDNNYCYCEEVDDYRTDDDCTYINNDSFNGYYANDWLEDNAYYCDRCYEWVDSDHWDDDMECCTDCSIGDLEGLRLIGGWHEHKGEYVIPPNHNDLIGHEIEVDREEEDNKALSDMVLELHRFDPTLIFEHDGSLDNGVEIITQPKTFDTANSDYYAHILEICKRYGFTAHESGHCGLHMHINRGYFGDDVVDQNRAIAKLFYFVEQHWSAFAGVSKREDFRYCKRNKQDVYLPMWKTEIEGRAVTRDAATYMVRNWNGDRYQAINLNNTNTVEIRLMRGTLNVDSFYALTDLVLNMIRFCKLEKWSTIQDPNNMEKFKTYLKDTTLKALEKRGGLY